MNTFADRRSITGFRLSLKNPLEQAQTRRDQVSFSGVSCRADEAIQAISTNIERCEFPSKEARYHGSKYQVRLASIKDFNVCSHRPQSLGQCMLVEWMTIGMPLSRTSSSPARKHWVTKSNLLARSTHLPVSVGLLFARRSLRIPVISQLSQVMIERLA